MQALVQVRLGLIERIRHNTIGIPRSTEFLVSFAPPVVPRCRHESAFRKLQPTTALDTPNGLCTTIRNQLGIQRRINE